MPLHRPSWWIFKALLIDYVEMRAVAAHHNMVAGLVKYTKFAEHLLALFLGKIGILRTLLVQGNALLI